MLAAIYGAIFSAQRLTRPVQDLIAGTRAVGKGDFGTRLPLPSRDEMGFLVHSFNDMTKRLRRAREEATRSQQAVERERARLAIILARLSTGVLAIDRDLTCASPITPPAHSRRRSRAAASASRCRRWPPDNERFAQFVAAAGRALRRRARGVARADRSRARSSGARVLMCACTPLPGDDHAESEATPVGYIIVFDDITALLQAQRDAAWGEVARRLAHEIKNPLTPIQLSAERMRRRFLAR